ncbi:MAG: hypothetical protein ACRD2B_16465 [Terriglobia bacterium]
MDKNKKRMKGLQLTIALLVALAMPVLLAAAGSTQVVLPAGTSIDVELTSTISTSANQQGDPFTAQVEDPVFAHGEQVIAPGSMLRGHITFVKPPGRIHGKAEMRLVADTITTTDGKQFTFAAQLASANSGNGAKVKGNEGTLEGAGKDAKKGAEDTGIATAAGAGVGAMAAGGQGALYGAGIGALAGVIDLIAKHHKNIVLHPGTALTFVLSTSAAESKSTPSSAVSAPFICANCR